MRIPIVWALALTSIASAQEIRHPELDALLQSVDAKRLHGTVAKLVSFGTRNTLSDTASETRGIGAARRWLAMEFSSLAKTPGSRLQPFEDRFTSEPGPRIPKAVEMINTGVMLPGTDRMRMKEAIVLTGHYDSRASDVLNASIDAPGAVDDGSGTALTLELARVMAAEKPAVSVYFVAVAGEEQGLKGSAHLAKRLKAEGVRVLAMVSVDIAGNSEGQDGVKDNVHGRLWSEGVPAAETPEQKRLRQALGTENDGPAREWARYVKRTAERYVENLDLLVMLRRDRIARGSDHMSFAAEGFPAICLREMHEHYDRQHQDVRTVAGRSYGDDLEHFDAAYTAKLAKGLGAAIWNLSHAPAPPTEVTLGGAVSPDTRLVWKLPADPRITGIRLYRRHDDAVAWQRVQSFPKSDRLVLKDVPPDNEAFAVATVDAEGIESLPVSPSRLESTPPPANAAIPSKGTAMREPTYAPHGHFCWLELATTDLESAKTFYGSVFGWTVFDMPSSMGNYTIFRLHGLDVAAAYQMDPQRPTLARWNAYVAVQSADESAATAVELGGKLLTGPFDVENIGRMALIQDPGGATFVLWQSIKHFGAGIFGEPNSLCWTELMAHDAKQATEFYSGLFKWDAGVKESGDIKYTEWRLHGTAVGGMVTMEGSAFEGTPSQWASYFAVDDCDAKTAAAQAAGAKVLNAPTDVPDFGRFAVLQDPQGAVFYIIKRLKSQPA